jgi:SAM-dependent methyltransferase
METVSIVDSSRPRNGTPTDRVTAHHGAVRTALPPLSMLLGEVYEGMSVAEATSVQIEAAVDHLFRGLRELRLSSSVDQWQEMIRVGRAHRLLELVHHDPFTSRAYNKPRGYAGDAVMMDYIYGQEEDWAMPSSSKLGEAIFRYTTSAPASAGVRERRCYIAELLDRIGRTGLNPSVLSVAAGHLREASLSLAVRRRQFQRFVALDTDPLSIKEISRSYGKYGVEPVVANARLMLTGKMDLGKFDLVYSTGLYDYLADATAKSLTQHLFGQLNPGGRLVLANFLPGVRDVGYMEMYMGWHLIYRDRSQMMSLADQIPANQIEEIRIVTERNENVVIMEMTKR